MQLTYRPFPKGVYASILGIIFAFLTPTIVLANDLKTVVEALNNGEWEKAQQMINEIVPVYENNNAAKYWYYRGVIYDQQMRTNIISDLSKHYLDEALNAYHKTLEYGKNNPQYYRFAEMNIEGLCNYYINRSVQYYKMEYFEEAVEQLEIARQINPEAKLLTLYTAILNHQMEAYGEALHGYTEYLTSNSQDVALYRILANLTLDHKKDTQKAQELLQTALKKYPWDYNLLEDYYELLDNNHLLEKQQYDLDHQLSTNPKNPIPYYQLAHLHQKMHDYDEAIKYAKKAFSLAPAQPEVILQIAILSYNFAAQVINNTITMSDETFQQESTTAIKKCKQVVAEAITYLKKARKINPKHIYALQQLSLLYKWLSNAKRADIIKEKLKQKGGSELIEEMKEIEKIEQKEKIEVEKDNELYEE